MKTKRVIELLLKADPTGECECVIECKAIHSIHMMSGSLDSAGPIEIINRDPIHGNIVSGKITMTGDRVHINQFSIEDAIHEFAFEGEEFPVEVDIEDGEMKQNILKRLETCRVGSKDLVVGILMSDKIVL